MEVGVELSLTSWVLRIVINYGLGFRGFRVSDIGFWVLGLRF